MVADSGRHCLGPKLGTGTGQSGHVNRKKGAQTQGCSSLQEGLVPRLLSEVRESVR